MTLCILFEDNKLYIFDIIKNIYTTSSIDSLSMTTKIHSYHNTEGKSWSDIIYKCNDFEPSVEALLILDLGMHEFVSLRYIIQKTL